MRSVSRTEPMSTLTPDSTRSTPWTNSVLPPPRSITRNGELADRTGDGAGERHLGLLGSREDLRSHAEKGVGRLGELGAVRRVADRRGGDDSDSIAAGGADGGGVDLDGFEGALDRRRVEPAAAIDTLGEPGDDRPAVDTTQRAVDDIGDQ